MCACCPKCNGSNIVFVNCSEQRMGSSHKIAINCKDCPFEHFFHTSKELINESRGRNSFDINIRTSIAFRVGEIGRGFEAIKNFSRCMNIEPYNNKTYYDINKLLFDAYNDVAKESIRKAASDVNQLCSQKVNNYGLCRVLADGTWQKRAHESLNGNVTLISNGKCIDNEVPSKYSRGCQMWHGKKRTAEYDSWFSEHDCQANHDKSSGAMEAAGAVAIFNRSIKRNKLIYHEYPGDGDTSSFEEVLDSKPYESYDIEPSNLECVGHIQKRLGTRLRNKVKEYNTANKKKKNGILRDRRTLSGKRKLTEKVINSMQNYYGLAIRNNKNQLFNMKKVLGQCYITVLLWQMKNSAINSVPKGKKAGANGKFQNLQIHNMCQK